MNQPVVIIGMGQLGGVFARGFLRSGCPVYPIVRGMDMNQISKRIPHPEFVLLAVAENDFHSVLKQVPEAWRNRLGFLQNELLPWDWADMKVVEPTVMAVWFEKKKGKGVRVFQQTPVYGPNTGKVTAALGALDIAHRALSDENELLHEIVLKNLYVLTINIVGIKIGGTVGELWTDHRGLVEKVANELMDIQEHLTGKQFERDAMIASMVNAFGKAPDHNCRGRVAEERLERVLTHADRAGIAATLLRQIKKEV